MGVILSFARVVFQSVKSTIDDYKHFSKRISDTPGIPQVNASKPYWTIPPSSIASHGRDAGLPEYADLVIIGSGISGTCVAKTVFDQYGHAERGNAAALKVVMLEARDACSGATAR